MHALFFSSGFLGRALAIGIADALCLIVAIFAARSSLDASLPALPLELTATLGAAVLLAATAAFSFPLLLLRRIYLRKFDASRRSRVAILGTGDLARAVCAALRERPELELELIGFIGEPWDQAPDTVRHLGGVDELTKLLERFAIDRVVVAAQDRSFPFPAKDLLEAKLQGIRVESGIALYERITGRVYLRNLPASYLIFSPGFRRGRISAAATRSIDVAASVAGLVLAAPLLALCAIAIRLEAAGPVLYRQQRVGRGGGVFEPMRLRARAIGAQARITPGWAAGQRADRVTRVGAFLCRARLDGLPQLWNVLRGEMSLVGPRPERPESLRLSNERHRYFQLRSAVKPGLTGWARVRRGHVNDLEATEDELTLDLFYVKHQSVFLDLLILSKALGAVVPLRKPRHRPGRAGGSAPAREIAE